jgi:hypothetical protein
MKLRALGTHANELSEGLGIIEKCLGELTTEEVGDLRATSCHKKAILEALNVIWETFLSAWERSRSNSGSTNKQNLGGAF